MAILTVATVSLAAVGDVASSPNEAGPSSAEAFNRWLFSPHPHTMDSKAASFASFQAMLEEEGVAEVVPAWQLWRVDAHYAKRCGTDYFLVPPESRWRQIIPTLRLLRDEVIPVTGPLEVASGYRSPEINDCVNGASRSKHLNFKALDLVATQITGREDIFKKLCILQNQIGRSKSMGLGAYYDPEDTQRGKMGRFHIDVEGYRTWGFDYTSKSNPCPKIL